MANWQQVKQYIHQNYVVSDDLDHTLKLQFSDDQGRTQLVFLTYESMDGGGEGWVNIESPVGKTTEIDLQSVLVEAGKLICGGLGAWAHDHEVLVLRHAVPIENLDTNELERPMRMLVATADNLERQFTSEDRY